MIIRCIKKCIK